MWGCYNIKNIKIGDLITTDNPNDTKAKWGNIIKINDNIIWVKYSSGLFKCLLDEIQAVQISILEDR